MKKSNAKFVQIAAAVDETHEPIILALDADGNVYQYCFEACTEERHKECDHWCQYSNRRQYVE